MESGIGEGGGEVGGRVIWVESQHDEGVVDWEPL